MAPVTLNAGDVAAAVRRRYGAERDGLGPEWACLDELTLGRFEMGERRADLFLVRAWSGQPKGHERHLVEVKVSRADLRAELAAPEKMAVFAAFAHRGYFATPAGLVKDTDDPGPGVVGVLGGPGGGGEVDPVGERGEDSHLLRGGELGPQVSPGDLHLDQVPFVPLGLPGPRPDQEQVGAPFPQAEPAQRELVQGGPLGAVPVPFSAVASPDRGRDVGGGHRRARAHRVTGRTTSTPGFGPQTPVFPTGWIGRGPFGVSTTYPSPSSAMPSFPVVVDPS